MKQILIIFSTVMLFWGQSVVAQKTFEEENNPYFGESCTSIMVGKKATTNGAVITSHTCDGRYRTWLNIEQGQTFKNDTVVAIRKGTMHTETPWDTRKVTIAGHIPQAKQTYSYLNTAYPCLNEKQLAMGETTISGHRKLVNKKGMFLIEELQRIALQRCKTAREAISLIGKLIKKYGYGDWGECITIADKNEVWQMEIFGEGENKIGGVWAAQRIPDDHIGVSANISRIGELDLDNKDYFMASDNVFKVAKKLKLWDGKEPFKFWKAYGNVKKPFKIREYFILNAVAPSLKLDYNADELPFSVKPDKKVSTQDVIAMFRETYEGTDFSMVKNLTILKEKTDKKTGEVIQTDTLMSPIANPWLGRAARNLYNGLKPETVTYQRTVAVSWCSYSHIIELRDWLPDEIGGRAWLSFDNPAQSPRVPIYSGATRLPESFMVCGQKRYRDDAAIWKYRKANKLATVRWQSTKKGMSKELLDLEQQAFQGTANMEKEVQELLGAGKKEEAQKLINCYLIDFTGVTMLRWKHLEDQYWHRFGLGF